MDPKALREFLEAETTRILAIKPDDLSFQNEVSNLRLGVIALQLGRIADALEALASNHEVTVRLAGAVRRPDALNLQ